MWSFTPLERGRQHYHYVLWVVFNTQAQLLKKKHAFSQVLSALSVSFPILKTETTLWFSQVKFYLLLPSAIYHWQKPASVAPVSCLSRQSSMTTLFEAGVIGLNGREEFGKRNGCKTSRLWFGEKLGEKLKPHQ